MTRDAQPGRLLVSGRMSTYDPPSVEKRRKRERDFEYMLEKCLGQVLVVGTFIYKQVEEINRKVDAMEVTTLASDTPAASSGAGTTKNEGQTQSAETPKPTLYTFTSGPNNGNTQDSQFVATGVRSADTKEALFTFSGDTAPGDKNGAGIAGYSVFTGLAEAVPAV
jgi:hypothetical protein